MSRFFILVLVVCLPYLCIAQSEILNQNKPEREEWFTSLGFGMFIHWSVDVQLGMVVSHTLVGASEDYLERYFTELPKTFDPDTYDPTKWAKIAKMAGMQYMVFGAKHHSGFCMYDTETTEFNVMNTPLNRDVTKEVLDAFRKEGIAVGLYFSPDDFKFLYHQGRLISRDLTEARASGNSELNDFDKKQLEELLTNYGKIEMVFIDGEEQFAKTELAKVCWEIDPNIVVTRGAMETPEQIIPEAPIPGPWEACFTLGDQWQFRPTNETYKSGYDLITKYVDIRAKGGNFLLNVSPNAQGEIMGEQADILNEFSLWRFINQEIFEDTEPWHITNEGDIWFLQNEKENTLYAIITNQKEWELGVRKRFLIGSAAASKSTIISVLGQNDKILEYEPSVDVQSKFVQTEEGILISVVRAQRIYNDRKWPNPIVVKLENVYPVKHND